MLLWIFPGSNLFRDYRRVVSLCLWYCISAISVLGFWQKAWLAQGVIIFWQDTRVVAPVDLQANSVALFHQSNRNPKSLFSSSFLAAAVNKHFWFDLCNNIMMCPSYHRLPLRPRGEAVDVWCAACVQRWGGLIGTLSAGISIHIKESCLVPFLLGNCRSQSLLPDVNGNKEKLFIDSEQKSPSGCFDFRETLPCKGSARLDCQCFCKFCPNCDSQSVLAIEWKTSRQASWIILN